MFPIFRSTPALVVGIPVARANFCFACEIPKARFHEKLRPGMGVDFLFILEYFISTTLLGTEVTVWLGNQFIFKCIVFKAYSRILRIRFVSYETTFHAIQHKLIGIPTSTTVKEYLICTVWNVEYAAE